MLAVYVFVLLASSKIADCVVYGGSAHDSRFDCTGKADGLAMIACDGYLECHSNSVVKHLCNLDQYFDRDTMSCLHAANNQTGCTRYNVCHDRPDGRYADPQKNCQTYYTCHGYLFFGHEYCPAGLVFNEALQICDWPSSVVFPCGTKSPSG